MRHGRPRLDGVRVGQEGPQIARPDATADLVQDGRLLAKDLGARGVKVRPNGFPKDVPEGKTLEQIGRSLNECGKIGGDNGVEIWMEVHGQETSLPANARKIMDACGHRNVGVTWNSNPTDVKDGSGYGRSPVTMLLQNGWICPMDDSGVEHEDGWVLVRDGLVEAVGGGAPPSAESVVGPTSIC